MSEVSGNHLSKLTGMAWRTVKRRLEASGIKPVRSEGSAHLFDSIAALAAIYEVAKASTDLDLNAERAALAAVQREKIEMDLAVRRGELGRISEMVEWFGGHVDRCRARLLQLPDSIGAICDPRTAVIVVPEARRIVYEALAELGAGGAPDAYPAPAEEPPADPP